MGFRALNARLLTATLGIFSTQCPLVRASTLPDQLALEVTACEASGFDVTEARRAINSELAADGVRVFDRASDGALAETRLSVSIDCDSALTTRLSLTSVRAGRERRRSIVLADADNSARARALALAVSEFVRSDWSAVTEREEEESGAEARAAYPDASQAPNGSPERESTQRVATVTAPATHVRAEIVPPFRGAPSDRARSSDPLAPRRAKFALATNARLRWFVDYSSVNWGADVGSDVGALRLRAEALFSSATDRLGSASMGSAALSFGYRVLTAKVGSISISGYPLLSAGVTWMRGSPARQSILTNPMTSAYGDLRFLLESRLDLSPFSPSLAAEVGRASGLVARAGDRVLGATGGFFVGLSAGANY